jgi:hypothetical protein
MLHAAQIREKVDSLLQKIHEGYNSKIEFINVNRYKKDYPHNNKKTRSGYTYQAAELKGYSYDGVEFFSDIKDGYLDGNGHLTLKKTEKLAGVNIYEVGVVPYEWIVYIDPLGDDTAYRPQFFAKFKGMYNTPYNKVRYYRLSENYTAAHDPLSMKYVSLKLAR